jgi:Zn-dependent metalloprotease
MVFGDGDGEIFNRFTIAIDVVAHELSHGVTESEAGLIYFEQSGALNESLSDVFGSLVKQYQRQQTADKADWIIGEGLLAKGIHGKGLRSMSQPGTAYDDPVLGKDPQPAHMKDFVHTQQDNGGVHINSGIPNHAFISPPAPSAVLHGRKRDTPGTTRCAINLWQKTPISQPLPG